MSGCGCAKKQMKKEVKEAENDVEEGDCSLGKEAYSDKNAGIFNALISIGAGAGGFYLSNAFNVKTSYSKTGVVLLSIIVANVLSQNMKLGNRIAGMMFDRKCKVE